MPYERAKRSVPGARHNPNVNHGKRRINSVCAVGRGQAVWQNTERHEEGVARDRCYNSVGACSGSACGDITCAQKPPR